MHEQLEVVVYFGCRGGTHYSRLCCWLVDNAQTEVAPDTDRTSTAAVENKKKNH